MDLDDLPAPKGEVIDQLVKQPLDRLSVNELEERIRLLEGEIARVEAALKSKRSGADAAEALFKK